MMNSIQDVTRISCLLLAAFCSTLVAAEEASTPQQKIAALSASEKELLLVKQKTFESLASQDQQKLRDLHAKISQHEKSERLVRVMDNYNQWLKTLSASRRAEILAMSKEERLQEIRKELEKGDKSRRRRWRSNVPLTRDDLRTFNRWLDKFLAQHRNELASFKDPIVDKLRDTRGSRRFILARAMFRRRDDRTMFDLSSIDQIVPQLSKEAQEQYDKANSDEDRRDIVWRWIRYSLMTKMQLPQFKEEILLEYFDQLTNAEDRKQIEMLGREKMMQELARRYLFSQMGSPRGRPPHDGPPDHFRGGSHGERERRGGPWRNGPDDKDKSRRRGNGKDGREPPPHERPRERESND